MNGCYYCDRPKVDRRARATDLIFRVLDVVRVRPRSGCRMREWALVDRMPLFLLPPLHSHPQKLSKCLPHRTACLLGCSLNVAVTWCSVCGPSFNTCHNRDRNLPKMSPESILLTLALVVCIYNRSLSGSRPSITAEPEELLPLVGSLVLPGAL